MTNIQKQKSSNTHQICGYTVKVMRVDLTKWESTSEILDEVFSRKYIGGTTLGIKFLYDGVLPGVEWSEPENRVFLGSRPLGEIRLGDSVTIAVITKGALIDGWE